MNMQKLAEQLKSGELLYEPEKVKGGLLHTVYRIITTEGEFALKVLNVEIMKRPEALKNMINSERIAMAFCDEIPVVASLVKEGKQIREWNGVYYMVFPWINGKSIYPGDINERHCEAIGQILGKMHKKNLAFADIRPEVEACEMYPWDNYLKLVKQDKNGEKKWVSYFEKAIGKIKDWNQRACEAQADLAKNMVISHRDLDPKNVLWENAQPYVIDWEAAGYVNPYQELIEVINYWADNGEGGLAKSNMEALLAAYSNYMELSDVEWEIVFDGGYAGMLGWLSYNLKRALGIEAVDEKERKLGEEQVKKTIREMYRYQTNIEFTILPTFLDEKRFGMEETMKVEQKKIWLFFDIGSTLVDETECVNFRIRETLRQENAPSEDEFNQCMEKMIAVNRLPYKDSIKEFNLEMVKWPQEYERLYPDVPEILRCLSGKYKLGVIANQSLGTEDRLKAWGIRKYFDVIVASAEAGVSKPEPEIFEKALKEAGCQPEHAYMIGDRLDNDIIPAMKLGMHTIWVRQGWFGKGNPALIENPPEIIVDSLAGILEPLKAVKQISLTTLCYIEKDNQYLMLHRTKKENDLNKDKWIGVGGHFEYGETPEECLLREVKEETGLTLTGYQFRGIITFLSDEWVSAEYMCLYTADGFEGELITCNEGTLEWVDKERVYELPIWEGDKIFFRLLETHQAFFSLKLCYEGNALTEAVLDGKVLQI